MKMNTNNKQGEQPSYPSSQDVNSINVSASLTGSTRNDLILTTILEGIQKSLQRMVPELPLWHSEELNGDQRSLKSHFKEFENLCRIYQWSDKEKPSWLQMTLRGKILDYIEDLTPSICDNYRLLKKDLLSVYHVSYDETAVLRYWSEMKWKPNELTLAQFASRLQILMKGILRNKTSDQTDLMLRNRFLEAISDVNPGFAQYIRLNMDHVQTFEELVTFANSKYSIFCQRAPRTDATQDYDSEDGIEFSDDNCSEMRNERTTIRRKRKRESSPY